MDKVAIVILNWNGKKFLQQYLPSVIKYSNLPGATTWVVDNASEDGSVEFLERDFPEVKHVSLDTNHGFAGGYNRGLKQIEAKYYLLLNSDVEVTANWLAPMLELLDDNPKIAACGPKIKAHLQPDYFEYAGAAGGYLDRYGYAFCRGRIFANMEKDTGQYDDEVPVFWATGACLMIRSKLFHQVGGFDDFFFAHMEEIDLCWRLKNLGYQIYYTSRSTIYHYGGGTLPQNNPRKNFLNYRNNLLLILKNLPRGNAFRIIFIRLWLDYLAGIMYLVNGETKNALAVLKAHAAFFKVMSRYRKKRKELLATRTGEKHPEILSKSVVFQFFIRKKKTFREIMAT